MGVSRRRLWVWSGVGGGCEQEKAVGESRCRRWVWPGVRTVIGELEEGKVVNPKKVERRFVAQRHT